MVEGERVRSICLRFCDGGPAMGSRYRGLQVNGKSYLVGLNRHAAKGNYTITFFSYHLVLKELVS